MADDKEIITPAIAGRLKGAKNGFWMNAIALTAVLVLMVMMALLNGPHGLARILFVLGGLLVGYVAFLVVAYDRWQEEKDLILGKKKSKPPQKASQSDYTNPNTAPTSRIDIEEVKKMTTGEKKT